MKERPILMTPENAQKCSDGSKTQTRRIINPQPPGRIFQKYGCWNSANFEGEWVCKFGEIGDRLWIQEAWAAYSGGVSIEGEEYDLIEGPIDIEEISPPTLVYKGIGDSSPERWRPAMHMYRWACRTVVEITDIRVQRVQEISEKDCIAEGCGSPITRDLKKPKFMRLWQSINGLDSWDANPWVWAITFKRLDTPAQKG